MRAEVTGLDEIKKVMSKLSEDIAVKTTRSALRESALIVKKEAIRRFDENWHTRTGNLKASIKVVKRKKMNGKRLDKHHPVYAVMAKRVWKRKRYKDSKGNTTTVKGLVADGYYAKFLEYGTSKIVAKPFLRPAGESKKDEAFAHFKKALLKKAKKIVEKR